MPQSLPQGKSSFLIETGPYMKEGIELQFDFVDNEGESIYLEPVSEYLEGTSRRISVEVYSDTTAGPANLIVVGELDERYRQHLFYLLILNPYQKSFKVFIMLDLLGSYNKSIAVNTQPIRFYTQPTISVSERFGTMVRTDLLLL